MPSRKKDSVFDKQKIQFALLASLSSQKKDLMPILFLKKTFFTKCAPCVPFVKSVHFLLFITAVRQGNKAATDS